MEAILGTQFKMGGRPLVRKGAGGSPARDAATHTRTPARWLNCVCVDACELHRGAWVERERRGFHVLVRGQKSGLV